MGRFYLVLPLSIHTVVMSAQIVDTLTLFTPRFVMKRSRLIILYLAASIAGASGQILTNTGLQTPLTERDKGMFKLGVLIGLKLEPLFATNSMNFDTYGERCWEFTLWGLRNLESLKETKTNNIEEQKTLLSLKEKRIKESYADIPKYYIFNTGGSNANNTNYQKALEKLWGERDTALSNINFQRLELQKLEKP
jgi:hypothetical protein